jgi:hypothetical protein
MNRQSSNSPALKLIERDTADESLHSAFQRLAELSTLEANWDSYGADPPTSQAIARANQLLSSIAGSLTAPGGGDARPWFIAPVADGGVQLEWRGRHGAVEVEVGPSGRIGYLLEDGPEPHRRSEEDDDISLEAALGLIARIITP